MKNNNDIKRRWVLAILWMVFIFVMSQVPGEQSSKQSGFIIYVFSLFGLDLNSIWGELANYIIRKGAHFFEYAVLAILIGSLLYSYRYTWMNRIIYALFMVLLCAILDEYFQSFVDGRNSSVKDILIDFSGAIVGCLFLELMMITKIKIKSLFLSKVSSYKKC